MARMLGRLPPQADQQQRLLRFARYIQPAALPPAPPAQDWTAACKQPWGVMGNDTIGDCTFAAIGHAVQTWTANSGGEVTLPDSTIIGAYSALTGYDPATGANDNGATEVDVLNYWRANGVGGHSIGAYVALTPGNQREMMEACYLFGTLYLGLALPLAAQSQLNSGQPWTVPSHVPFWHRRKWEVGSWGGHAVISPRYDVTGIQVITWGATQNASWDWVHAYCEEVYAVISSDWVSGARPAPNGFDMAALQQDLQAVTSL